MADDAEKAEKLAAAKKRVEALKKKNAKKSGGASKKDKKEKEKEEREEPTTAAAAADEAEAEPEAPADDDAAAAAAAADDAKEKKLPIPPVSAAVQGLKVEDKAVTGGDDGVPDVTSPSVQSKMRSASFKAGGPLSPGFPFTTPDGEVASAADIYRKQVARIEDLEKENKRLAKEAADAEKRWQKAEGELDDLRESAGDEKKADAGADGEVEKLQAEIASLQRQNDQLQSAASRRGHGSSPSVSASSPPAAELQAQLASKATTIENMELELSRLRAQAARQEASGGTDKDQIVALEEKLARAEQAASKATRELVDLKRNLERTTEKAVREGSSRTSAETRVKTLEQENSTLNDSLAELQKKHDALEKKVQALGNLHKENDSRTQSLRREKEAAEKETTELKSKVERLEAENTKLRKKDAAEGGGDDDGIDELENEERQRLEKKIRDLEAEIYDLRRGIWHQRRREMEAGAEGEETSPGGDFTNIDLSAGPLSPTSAARKASGRGTGLGDFFTSGLNALTGAAAEKGAGTGDDEGLLEDDDLDFDEDAFRRAHEEDAKKRLERIKEIKRGLKNWEGWRLDLVDTRRGGGYGVGEVFEI
ncbi:m protein repeat protein [Apiospora arundinis]|uniref:M protein repeat protein n=1 Tax=Apiospora arundinis TaxID=335852 RepID=A0ABR2J6L1_9PEZI